MSRLVQRHSEEAWRGRGGEGIRVQEDIARQRSRHQRPARNRDRERVGRHRLGSDTDIAETCVVLCQSRGAEGLAAVEFQTDIDISVRRPSLERGQNLPLPSRRCLVCVEGLEQGACMAGDRRAVRREAQRELASIAPGEPGRC